MIENKPSLVAAIEIAKKQDVKADPNRFNCAGFIVAVLTGEKEIRYMPDGTDMSGFLKDHAEVGTSTTYDLSLASAAKFIAIGFHKQIGGEEFIQFFHFSIIDQSDPSKVFQRNGTGAPVESGYAQDMIQEYLDARPWKDALLQPIIHYFN